VAGDLRISMLIEANAQRAKAEVASLREEVVKLAPAGEQAAAGLGRAADGAAEWGSMVQMLRASMQPMVAEANALAAAADQLAVAEEMGALSAREAALAHDMLARQAIELQARMEALGVTLDGSTASLRQQDTAVQQLIARTTGLSRATDETIADHLRHGQALDQLRAKFDPLFAVSRQYELALGEIAEAERLGAISATTAVAARERLAQSMVPAVAGVDRFGRSNQMAAQYAGQLSYQLNDIAMMMALGQSPFMLMMQQGPQVVQVFGDMQRSGVGLGGALSAAFGLVINPMSLATMAVIGFGAAAVHWLTQASEQAEKLASTYEKITQAASASQLMIDKLRFGVDEDYQVELLQEQIRLRSTYNSKVGELNAYLATTTDSIDRQRVQTAELVAEIEATATAYQRNSDLLADQEDRSIQLAILEGIRAQRAGEAAAAQAAADQSAKALAWARQTLASLSAENEMRILIARHGQESAVVAAARANAEREVFAALVDSRIASTEMRQELMSAYDAAKNTAGVNLSANIATAVGWAASLANNLWDAARANAAVQAGVYRQTGEGPAFERGGRTGDTMAPYIPPALTLEEVWKENNPVKGGGGGGGGASEIDSQTDALKSLREEQERQIALLRTTDPIQRLILENHEALAGATSKEKDEVIALILERERLEKVAEALDQIKEAGGRAFVDLVTGAASFGDALTMVLDQMAQMAASSLWDMFWGGTGNGDGGLGGLLSDWLMPGAQTPAAAKSLPLSQVISGSLAGSTAPAGWTRSAMAGGADAGASAARQRPMVQIINQSQEPIREAPGDGPDVEETVKLIVGRQMARGNFDQQQRARYGVSPEIAKR
jgi:hypothetical protein